MKSIQSRFHTAALVSLILPIAAFAQATGSSEDKPTGAARPGATGTTGTGTSSTTGTANAPGTSAGSAAGQLGDPATLFRQLDTDRNGQLSREEFSRITTAMGASDRTTPGATTTPGSTTPGSTTPGTTKPGTTSPGTTTPGTGAGDSRTNQR